MSVPMMSPKPNDPEHDAGLSFAVGITFWLVVALAVGGVLRWLGG